RARPRTRHPGLGTHHLTPSTGYDAAEPRWGDDSMARPVTVDFHAHAQSPKAMELIANAPANPGAETNPHNQMLGRTVYHAAFTDLNVRLQTMDRERIDMQAV